VNFRGDPAVEKDLLLEAFRLAAIVNSSEDAIVSKNLDGIIQSWNASAERMFGYTAAEAVGKSIRMIIPADRQSEEDLVLARIRSGLAVEHFETIRQRKDGSKVEISLSVSPVRDGSGQIVGAAKIARDITTQKALARQLAEAVRVKDEFLATLSHELRTPLNAVMGYIRMLRAGHIPADRFQDVLAIVDRNASALSKLVSDVLDTSAIVTGKARLRVGDCDVAEVLRDAVEAVRPPADAKRLRLSVNGADPAIRMQCDTDRMRQVFWNVLNNAVKFTPENGRITVNVIRSLTSVEVVVEDNGRGIAASFLPHVFEPFRQANAIEGLTREHGGLGLGLSLVRHFVELHGGRVTASSPGEGQGATFRITLPLPPVA
jgi:PAS domain S-box-containing protein